jgi:hypothetical protein
MKPSFSTELENLYDKRKDLLERKKDFFEGDEPDYNDQGYQDILSAIDEVNIDISDIEKDINDDDSIMSDVILIEDEDGSIDDGLEDNYTIDDF